MKHPLNKMSIRSILSLILIFCHVWRNPRGEEVTDGKNLAVFKVLKKALAGGWTNELIDQSRNELSPFVDTRTGGEEITLKEKTYNMIDWHLADEPLRKFNQWNPYDKGR